MKNNFFATLMALMFVLAQTANPQGANMFFTSSTATDYDNLVAPPVDVQLNDFSTEIIAQMAGGPVLFDETFNAAYSDPAVQAAVALAVADLTGAGAASYAGPTETSFLQTLVDSSSATTTNVVATGVFVATTEYSGPQTIMVGDNQSQSFTLLAGQEDFDTLVTTDVTNLLTTTVTDTYLDSSVYNLLGEVPEPNAGWLLGVGAVALALSRWRKWA